MKGLSAAESGDVPSVSGRGFILVAVVGLLCAGVCLALGSVLDSTIVAVAGVLFVVAVLAAREGWLWHGDLRGWVTMMAALAAVVVVAYAISSVV